VFEDTPLDRFGKPGETLEQMTERMMLATFDIRPTRYDESGESHWSFTRADLLQGRARVLARRGESS
jgi:hypothetical protein